MDKEIYVLAVEDDAAGKGKGRSIVWEQHLAPNNKEAVEKYRKLIGDRYGRTAIAKLVFDKNEDVSWLK